MAECRSCGKPIDWAKTTQGKLTPVDTDSAGVEGGNLAVWRGPKGQLFCRVLTKDEAPWANEKWGTSHWATCPQSKTWKKPS